MGMMDNLSSNMDDMKARYEELRSKEQAGSLDDKGRAELDKLRSHFEQ